MKPFLLDEQYVLRLAILYVVSILICFIGGYVLGFQHAAKALPEALISQLLLPDAGVTKVNFAEEYSATANEPGKNIDVDMPDSRSPAIALTDDVTSPNVIAKLESQHDIISNQTSESSNTKLDEPSLSLIVDNATLDNALYSIQVGLYGIQVNAQRRVDALIGNHLSGHLSSFINTKGDTLYNVRFGYFLDKASVQAALDNYQLQHPGEGYVVRLKK